MTQPKAYSYIRFSTPEQEKGDSYRRQLEKAENWANDNDLELDNSLRMTDRGLSGYHGAHRTKGALGEFLKKVNQGKIAIGSVLLIENMDRLSREKPMIALRQFDEIIRAGIKVVTLQSGMEYTEESINKNSGQLYIIIGEIQRANAESERKSYLLKNAWDNKRRLGKEGKIITRKCPSWLKVSDDRKKFIIIPERVEAIKRVFELRAEGKGYFSIEKTINKMDVWAPTGRDGKTGWRRSYITKLLVDNPSVIGVFQPYHKILKDGKRIRVPIGSPIHDYYPAIISEDLYNKVQQIRIKNKNTPGRGGGRTGNVRNLFGHIAKCHNCGGSMSFINKGPGNRTYLICDRARRGLDCDATGKIKYDIFEEQFLTNCWSLRVNDVLPRSIKQKDEMDSLQERLDAFAAELDLINEKLENLYDSIESTKDKQLRAELEGRATDNLSKKSTLERKLKKATARLSKLKSLDKSTEKQLKDIRELIEMLRELEGDALIDIRLKLRNHLRMLIDNISCEAEVPVFKIKFHSGHTQIMKFREDGTVLTMTRTRLPKNKS